MLRVWSSHPVTTVVVYDATHDRSEWHRQRACWRTVLSRASLQAVWRSQQTACPLWQHWHLVIIIALWQPLTCAKNHSLSLGRVQEECILDKSSRHITGTAFYGWLVANVGYVKPNSWLHVICILVVLNVMLRDDVTDLQHIHTKEYRS